MVSKRGARWRAAAVTWVLTLGTVGLAGAGAGPARADSSAADQACTAAGGTPTDYAQGWVTQCALTTGNGRSSYTWSPPANTRGVIFDLFGAQGAPVGVGAAGRGGEASGTFATPNGPVQINIGGQYGSSGPNPAYDGGTPRPYAGGHSAIGTSGGGATVAYAVSAGPSQPLVVAGGGGGSGMSGVVYDTNNFSLTSAVPNGGNGGVMYSPATNGSQGATVKGGYDFAGGAGGQGGSNGGAGGDGAPSGSNVGTGGAGNGGYTTYAGGGGGGYVGGGAGGDGSGNVQAVSGSGGGGGGSSWIAPSATDGGYHDGVQTGDGKATVTTLNGVGQYNDHGFIFYPGQVFAPGAAYVTGRYELVMQTDGNLVTYNDLGAPLWSSGTDNHPGAHAVLQTDGDLVIYADAAQTRPLWRTGSSAGTSGGPTEALFSASGVLSVENFAANGSSWDNTNIFNARPLYSGESWVTGNGTYLLTMQTDGNLVEYKSGVPIWASRTAGHPGAYAVMQGNGNFVVYEPGFDGSPLWWTGTTGTGATQLALDPDGALVMTNAGGAQIWSSRNIFTAGMTLQPGEQYLAGNGTYMLAMQGDGNLVEYNAARQPVFASNTAGHPGAFAVMQSDGNFVVYADQARRQALWATHTNGSGAVDVNFQSDGNLVLYRGDGSPVWASNTVGK